jgi:hypothetical protein
VPKEALVREMRSFGFALRTDMIAWPDGQYLAVFSAMPAGSNTRPRAMRELPVFASTRPVIAPLEGAIIRPFL